MASWRWKHGHVVIEYWDADAGDKLMLKPRSSYAYLDKWSEADIDAWVERWEQEQGPKVDKVKKATLLETDEVKGLFDSFLKAYAIKKKIAEATIEDENRRFYGHIAPIMVEHFGAKDVRIWGTLLPSLETELLARGKLKEAQVNKCLGLLKRFSRNLKRRGILAQAWDVEYAYAEPQPTPLLARKFPEHVLACCLLESDWRARLQGLLSYFGPFRPEEQGPMEKEDWISGEKAIAKSTTYFDLQKITIGLQFFPFIEPRVMRSKTRKALPPEGERGEYPGILRKPLPKASPGQLKKLLKNQVALGSKLVCHVKRKWNRKGKVVKHTKKENLQKRKGNLRTYAKIDSVGEYVTIWYPPAAKEIAKILKDLPPGPIFKGAEGRDYISRAYFFKIWSKTLGRILKATMMDLRRGAGNFLGRVIRIEPTLLQEIMRHEHLDMTEDYMRDPMQPDPEDSETDFDDV